MSPSNAGRADLASERPAGAPARSWHVCLVTGGGDAPGLNAAVRAFYHAATGRSVRVSASRYGFEGLLGRAEIAAVTIGDVQGILPRGGSIFGCSTLSNPFMEYPEDEAAAIVRARLSELGLDAIVLAGGDGTMGIARRLSAHGVHCVGIPKTIDGDLPGTERTCGLDTAVAMATSAIDALHSTAEAHRRVMVVEVMGRNAGWIALEAGLAGGADVVLIPEIAYDPARVVAKVRDREALGRRFSIIVIGEGARSIGGGVHPIEPAEHGREARLTGAGEQLARELATRDLGHEVRVTVLGHLQRGHAPTASDRLLGTRCGAHAAELCAEGRFGRMVVMRGGEVGSMPLSEIPAGVRRVDPAGSLVRCARAIGIELGAAA